MLGAVWRAPGQGPKGLALEPGAAAKAPSGPDLSATTFKRIPVRANSLGGNDDANGVEARRDLL